MDLSTMRNQAREILGQTDASNTSITNLQLTAWAQEFYRKAAIFLEMLPIEIGVYSITDEDVSLDVKTVTINRVKMKIQPENKWTELRVVDLSDMMARDPDWENAETGKPEWFVRMGTFDAMLYPPPDAANANQSSALKTYGLELPNNSDLEDDTDYPDLPRNIHDLFPYFMAYKGFIALGEYDKASVNLSLVNEGLKQQKLVTTKFSDNKGWTWYDSDPGASDWAS